MDCKKCKGLLTIVCDPTDYCDHQPLYYSKCVNCGRREYLTPVGMVTRPYVVHTKKVIVITKVKKCTRMNGWADSLRFKTETLLKD